MLQILSSTKKFLFFKMMDKKNTTKGEDYYIDPDTGLLVFTAKYLLERGHCCESGCKHCPYGYKKLSSSN